MNKEETKVYGAFLSTLKKDLLDERTPIENVSVNSRSFLSFCQALATVHQMSIRNEELKLQKKQLSKS